MSIAIVVGSPMGANHHRKGLKTMTEREVRERDILVGPNEYAYVQDLTKGNVILYVGPTKISLSNTERLIILEEGRFVPIRRDEVGNGVHKFAEVNSSEYVVLENPPEEDTPMPIRGANSTVPLRFGRKVVIPGPTTFPLWPGQRAKVIEGHRLRQNQYLIVRRYDDEQSEDPIGTETIVRGTEVSFFVPSTGLEVIPHEGQYVRQAIRMNVGMGLHLRVISKFVSDEDGQVPPGEYRAGQDIFLSGREGYFFPTDHIRVVGTVSAIALAEKEAVYVRSMDTGIVRTIEGPANLLIDPTKAQLVHRQIPQTERDLYGMKSNTEHLAPTIYIPPSTAILVTSKDKREVVIGPQRRILDYTEKLEVLTLSTGRPKTDTRLLPTCFLQTQGNKVSDMFQVETADHVALQLELSYRVSFSGQSSHWFDVKNYVALLCDHLGSIVRAVGRATPIDVFYGNSTEVIRTAILGPRTEEGIREGRHFEENGMWVYDVEVLDVNILDDDVSDMLCEAQRSAIESTISRRRVGLHLGDRELEESVKRQISAAEVQTLHALNELQLAKCSVSVSKLETELKLEEEERIRRARNVADARAIELETETTLDNHKLAVEKDRLAAQVSAFGKQMAAIQPELVNTLKQLGNQQLVGALSKNLSPLAILGGESVAEVTARLLDHLPMGTNPNLGGTAFVQDVLGTQPERAIKKRGKKAQ